MARKKEKATFTLVVEFNETYDDDIARDLVYSAENAGGTVLKAEFYLPAAPAKTVNLLSD